MAKTNSIRSILCATTLIQHSRNRCPFLSLDLLDDEDKLEIKIISPCLLSGRSAIIGLEFALRSATLGEWDELYALSSEEKRSSAIVSASHTANAKTGVLSSSCAS